MYVVEPDSRQILDDGKKEAVVNCRRFGNNFELVYVLVYTYVIKSVGLCVCVCVCVCVRVCVRAHTCVFVRTDL